MDHLSDLLEDLAAALIDQRHTSHCLASDRQPPISVPLDQCCVYATEGFRTGIFSEGKLANARANVLCIVPAPMAGSFSNDEQAHDQSHDQAGLVRSCADRSTTSLCNAG
jgi:hypothetical protein